MRLNLLKNILLAPLALLIGAEGGGSAAETGGSAPETGKPAPETGKTAPETKAPAAVQPSAADIAAELMKALDTRSQRLEGSIAKSIAEKYGMSEDEINKILSAEKEKRDKALPADVQKQLDEAMAKANDKLIAAEIRVQATALGFVDADDAAALVDRSGIKLDDKGEVTGVKESLEALAKKKPHLIKPAGSWGMPQGTGAGGEITARDEMRSKLFGGNK